MVADADLVGGTVAGRGAVGRHIGVGGRGRSAGNVEDTQLLVLAAGRENTWAGARRESNRADDVRVIQGHESLACESVPNPCAEIGAAGCSESGIFGESRTPNSTLVSNESSNPIAGQAVAQHGILVFAGRDHVVLRAAGAGVEGGREAQVGDGS